LHAGSADRRKHPGPVIGAKRTDRDWAFVAKMRMDRMFDGFRHDGRSPWAPIVHLISQSGFAHCCLIWIKREFG
jgi:hypothetical protein